MRSIEVKKCSYGSCPYCTPSSSNKAINYCGARKGSPLKVSSKIKTFPRICPLRKENTSIESRPQILDACCGGKMFWFDKENKNVLFTDIRREEFITGEGKNKRNRKVLPDQIEDFRNMSHSNESFRMVVFDPPHLFAGATSYMGRIYGRLDKKTWEEDLRKGFSECFRVLKPGGFLIFKWNESDVPLKEVLKLTEHKPLFGHPSGKAQKTHWLAFMKTW
jgi:SAM-dependent methyltransferase